MGPRQVAVGLVVGLCALWASPAWSQRAPARYAADTQGILWFLHLSDTHVGAEWFEVREDPAIRLAFALNEGVEVTTPSFVVVTGDLVDGSRFGIPTAGQDQAEWDKYRQAYTDAGMTADFYFDVIGNHDLYGDRGGTFYLANSLQGQAQGAAHFSWTRAVDGGEYFFYALNSAGDNVPVFSAGEGEILDTEYDALVAALDANASARLQFVFAHHPPLGPQSSTRVANLLAERGAYYVHGHRHDYQSYLELNGSFAAYEAASLGKSQSGNIAVGAIDHDGFAYRATDIGAPWPLVLVTAPMDRLQGDSGVNPWSYPVCKDRPDNPVRALVFSKEPPTGVSAQVGGLETVALTPSATVPRLWVGTMNTSPLDTGVHELEVSATTASGSDSHTVHVELTAGPCIPLATDGGVPADGGPPPDGGEEDGGVAQDGGPSVDGGEVSSDAGPGADGGGEEDDAGTTDDGGTDGPDGSSSDDGGTPAGTALDGGDGPPSLAGRGCDVGAGSGAGGGLAWLALVALLWTRRRRRKQTLRCQARDPADRALQRHPVPD